MPKMPTAPEEERSRRLALAEFNISDRELANKIEAEIHRPATSLVNRAGPAVDVDALWQMMAKLETLPRPPFFGAGRLFSADSALCFKIDGRHYALAHPDFWARIPAEKSASTGLLRPLSSIEIIDLDHPANRAARDDAVGAMMRATGLE